MIRLVFPLLLLAAPVWAGEPSSASGSLRVQVGAAPQLEKDTSKCFLKGAPVPCVGHAYDRRVGVAALESTTNDYHLACYLKMREAMREMDTVIEKFGKSDGVGTELALTHLWIAEHWRPVMKECVE